MNALVWKLPSFIHDFILWLTGWRMTMTTNSENDDVIYGWVETWD